MTTGTTRVGFIGLGAMGQPMCRNLLKAGFPLTVWNRSRPAVDELAAAGAQAGASAAGVAARSDVVITCVPSSPQVTEVITGPEGVLEGIAAGATVIDMSTLTQRSARRWRPPAPPRASASSMPPSPAAPSALSTAR